MYCSQCGAKQESETAKFCGRCGAPLVGDADVAQATAGKPKGRSLALLAALAIACLALVAGIAFALSRTVLGGSAAREAFVGVWTMESSSAEGMDEATVAELRASGFSVNLTLEQDGTGVFDFYLIDPEVRWKASSETRATMTRGDETIGLELVEGKLVASFPGGGTMTLVPADTVAATVAPWEEADASEQADSTSSAPAVPTIVGSPSPEPQPSETGATAPEATPSQPGTSGAESLMGNPKVGFIQIPASWANRTSDLGTETIDSTAAVYFVNPESEYTSPTIGSFAFAQAIQMSLQPTSYEELANTLASAFASSDAYGQVEAGFVNVGGHNAILITTSLPADGLQLCTIVIDRDGDGHAAVVLSCNCGTNEAQASEVLSYASTWSMGL